MHAIYFVFFGQDLCSWDGGICAFMVELQCSSNGYIPYLCNDLPNSGSVFPGIIHCPWHHYTIVKDLGAKLKFTSNSPYFSILTM